MLPEDDEDEDEDDPDSGGDIISPIEGYNTTNTAVDHHRWVAAHTVVPLWLVTSPTINSSWNAPEEEGFRKEILNDQ